MDANGIEARETVPASRKLGRSEASAIAKASTKVIVAKGRKVESFEPGGKAPKTVVDAMLGPTGNLRAPTLRAGKLCIVGFDEETYSGIFG